MSRAVNNSMCGVCRTCLTNRNKIYRGWGVAWVLCFWLQGSEIGDGDSLCWLCHDEGRSTTQWFCV